MRRFEDELRISPVIFYVILLLAAVALPLLPARMVSRAAALDVALVLFSSVAAAALAALWNRRASTWALVAALAVAVLFTSSRLDLPALRVLLFVPALLASGAIGLWHGATVAAGLVAALLLPQRDEVTITAVAVTAVALAQVLYALLYGRVMRLAEWSWVHFERARELLEEARDRQSQLKEALDALAHANHQLTLTNEKLATMRLLAERAERTKADFAANVSHEFRTPLNMIIGLVDLLTETPDVYGQPLPRELLRDLDIVHRNCEHLSSMIDDVLDLSQVEAGRLALHKQFVDLRDMIERAIEVVGPLLAKKHLTLDLHLPATPPEIYCDPTRIRQVVLNLVSNAARFTDHGGITVSVAVEGDDLHLSVADTGPGIAAHDLERIFQPFQQGSAAHPDAGPSSGLGLSISKRFVELHGGKMWAESELGHGSTFCVRLPLQPAAEPMAPPQRWIAEGWVQRRASAQVSGHGLNQRVVVWDETGELPALLKRYGNEVDYVRADSLEGAIGEIEDTPAHALIVNGRQVDDLWAHVERANRALPDMPIVGCCLPRRLEHALSAGATGYLLKPVTRGQLAAALNLLEPPPRRVLVVDDEPDALHLMARMLQSLDPEIEVLTSLTGEGALAAMASAQPDLVLLDVILPDMDGWHVLDARRGHPTLERTKVLMVSAQDPLDQPLASRCVVATMGHGLSIGKLLTCSQHLSTLLLQPD